MAGGAGATTASGATGGQVGATGCVHAVSASDTAQDVSVSGDGRRGPGPVALLRIGEGLVQAAAASVSTAYDAPIAATAPTVVPGAAPDRFPTFEGLRAEELVRRALRPELARNAPWRVSSTLPEYPAAGRGFSTLEGGPDIFFHTRTEAEPWVEFDLGAGASVESVRVQNRLDCCRDRAALLVVECSADAATWRELARRAEPFYEWTATFARTPARYVRLRAPRTTTLHLAAVEIR